MAGPASIAPSHAVSQAKSSSSGSSSDDVSEGTLAQNNTKWQLRGLYVSLGGSLGWALVIALGWVLLESSPVAESVSSSTGVKDLHTYCAVAWSTFAGLAGMGMLVAGAGAGAGNYLKSLCVTVGLVMSSYYIFEINGTMPIWLSAAGSPTFIMRLFAWFFTTSLLIFALWASSDCKLPTLWTALAFDWGMLASRLAGFILDGNWRYGTFAAMLLCGGGLLLEKMTMFSSLGNACKGFPKALASVRRLQVIHMLSWTAFPVILALDTVGVLSPYQAELCTAINEVLAFGMFAEAMGQGVLKLSGDRRTTRLQSRSLDLVKQLQEAEKRKDRFFAAMSHELRTPLNGIIGLTDSLLHSEKESLTPKAVRSLTTVVNTARRFGKLINTILDSASIKEKKMQLSLAPVSIHQVVEEAVGLINPIIPADVKVAIQVPDNIPLLHADYNRLMQIMYNLLGNAAKFCTKGAITVRAMQMSKEMLIEVEDTGIGIEEDKLKLVFEAFEQVDNSQSRSYGGTGLGLNLALELAKAHKGGLKVRSTFGKGTVFTLSLPMVAESNDTFVEDRKEEVRAAEQREADIAEAGEAAAKQEKNSESQIPKGLVNTWLETKNEMSNPYMATVPSQETKTIELLSVDDDPVNQDVMQDLLGGLGYKVTVAMSGIEALKILEERFETEGVGSFPSVVLMDNMMPGMTGLEATRKIREIYPMVEMPIIMVTANDDEHTVCKALREGCNDFVTKPVKRSELDARVALQIKLLNYYSKEVESRKQEQILKEILPPSIIQRLSVGQTRIADRLEKVTVLFADIVGFTAMSANHSTKSIVTMLDSLFSAFDSLTDKLGVQKIETIGDCYMVVCGLEGEEDQAERMVMMAKEMLKTASEITSPSGKPLSIRVGMHTGPAYAGVVGQKCPRYCLFGDTVNTASRMESTGFPAAVHLSNSTYELFQESEMSSEVFFCDLGERDVKGKGAMQSWLLQDGEWEAALQQHVEELKSASNQSSVQPFTPTAASGQVLAAAAAADGGGGSVAASSQDVMRFSDKLNHIGSHIEVLPEKMDSLSLQVKELRQMILSPQGGFNCPEAQEPELRTVAPAKCFKSVESCRSSMDEATDLYDQVPPTPGGNLSDDFQPVDPMAPPVLKDAAQRAANQLSGIGNRTRGCQGTPVPPDSANIDQGGAREGVHFNREATGMSSHYRETLTPDHGIWDSVKPGLVLPGDGGPSTDMLHRLQQEALLKSLMDNNQLAACGYANPMMSMLAPQSFPKTPSPPDTPDSDHGPGQPMHPLLGRSVSQPVPSNALGQEQMARQLFMAQQAQQAQQMDAVVVNQSLMQMLQYQNSVATAGEKFRMLQAGAQNGIAMSPSGEEGQLLTQASRSVPELAMLSTEQSNRQSLRGAMMGLQAVPDDEYEGGQDSTGRTSRNRPPPRASHSFRSVQRSVDSSGSASMEQQQQQLYVQQLLVQQQQQQQQQQQRLMQQQQQLLQQQFMQQQPQIPQQVLHLPEQHGIGSDRKKPPKASRSFDHIRGLQGFI